MPDILAKLFRHGVFPYRLAVEPEFGPGAGVFTV